MSPHAAPGTRKLSRCPSHALHLKGPVSFLNPTVGFVDASRSNMHPVRRPQRHRRRSQRRPHSMEDGRRSSLSPTSSQANDETTTDAGTPGSVVWVINGFFVWLPLQDPASAFAGEPTLGGGITAFIGATVFELGSVLLMLEAVNENRTDCFGWALENEAAAAAAALC
ncbi:hypothetical protein PG994_006723 [Apiospora phragmitis]|uniref:Uncharacterized protein n=1 Tax=Apiospora phragmitis TaxID=2905665 RepID=A0ABR1VG28_9PEZI